MSSSSLRQWGVYSLAAESSDTSPGLLLCFDGARYVFGAGEGTTRTFVAKSAGFKKLGTLFVSRADSKAAGGLPGLLLTLSEHHGDQTVVTDLDLIGPPKLSNLIAASRFHARRNMTDMRVHETLPSESTTREPIYTDECVRVFDFAVRSASSPARPLKRKRSASDLPPVNGSKRVAAQLVGAEAKDWLRTVIQDMFHGPEYLYRGPRPSPAWDQQLLPQPDQAEADIVTSYLVIGPQHRGRFLPDKAKALGVPKGPLFGKLHKGERVQLEDGRWIEPDSCVAEDGPRHAFLLVECPDQSCVDQLAKAPLAQTIAAEKATLKVVYHMLGKGVVDSAAYWQWANSLGADVEHVVSSPDLAADQVAYGGAFLLQLRLAKLAPDYFPTPHFSLQGKRDLASVPHLPKKVSLLTPDRRWELGAGKGEFAFATTPRTFDLQLETPEAEKRLAQLHTPGTSPRDAELTKAGEEAWRDFVELTEVAKQDVEREAGERKGQARRPMDDVVVTTLGTGSASPSVYRNVSGTLVELPEHGAILLDCGENTLGQLRRLRGPEATDRVLRSLRLICISHMHSDHHANLGGLLHARAQLGDAPPLVLIAPRPIWLGMQDHDAVESLALDSITFMSAASLIGDSITAPEAALKPLGLNSIKSVEVDHRGGQCFGFVIESSSPSWKLVYSGDTRPTDKLVAAGHGADLLVHEATLDDEHEAQAKFKGHSTTGQALDVAKRMNAHTVLLTHFSQRYPKLTTLSPELLAQEGRDVVLAFDGMQMRVGDAWKGKHFLRPMQALLRDLDPTSKKKGEQVMNVD